MSPCRPPPALVLAWPPVLPLAIWLSDAGAPPISDVRLLRFASCRTVHGFRRQFRDESSAKRLFTFVALLH